MKAFQIGLVGAGAISAGAYTGGVVDFLIQALDEWESQKAGPEVPKHAIELKVFSGSSAGGMTAAIAAGFIGSNQPHIATEADARDFAGQNKLFDSWVESIDIKYLLETQDLDAKKDALVSVLDSTVLSSIAGKALDISATGSRAYIADDFQLLLTVTNLRGVPYAISLAGTGQSAHMMNLHADYMHFSFSKDGAAPVPNTYGLLWNDLATPGAQRDLLLTTAIATGAFPVGLAPRVLSHVFSAGNSGNSYASRLWDVSTDPEAIPHQCKVSQAIPTHFGNLPGNYQYEFVCVDGGVMNNEPLELARKVLAAGGGRNAREGDKADRAMILIDPFPSDVSFDANTKPETDLLKSVMGMFGALVNQARFKPDELTLAQNEHVYSRFMIAPSRDGEKYTIACGSLGGFGGFLKRDFRAHDYFLGRRNAQKFLRDHCCLPETNPLFSGDNWAGVDRTKFYAKDADGNFKPYLDNAGKPVLHADGSPVYLLPIIPLVGKATLPLHAPAWPTYSEDDFQQLITRVKHRAGAVLTRAAERYLSVDSWYKKLFAKPAIIYVRGKLLAFIKKTVRDDLQKRKLML